MHANQRQKLIVCHGDAEIGARREVSLAHQRFGIYQRTVEIEDHCARPLRQDHAANSVRLYP
jgi:hypothetical protein